MKKTNQWKFSQTFLSLLNTDWKINIQSGIVSAWCGVSALLMVITISYAKSAYYSTTMFPQRGADTEPWFIVKWIADLGLYTYNPHSRPEVRQISIFDISIHNFFLWGIIGIFILVFYSVFTALIAELRKEGSLYQSIGLICSLIAIMLLFPLAGLILGTIVCTCFFYVRNRALS